MSENSGLVGGTTSTPIDKKISINYDTPEVKTEVLDVSMEEIKADILKTNQESMRSEFKSSMYPTNRVDLPSKGLLYPAENPLSNGFVEVKFMTAKEEDILTSESYIKAGTVLDKLFQSLITTKIDYDSMLVGDRDAIMIAARIYGYGEIYETKIQTPSGKTQKYDIDLTTLKHKDVDYNLYKHNENLFSFTTSQGNVIEFKLLTNGDEVKIAEQVKKNRRGVDSADSKLSTRLCHMIQSVDGNSDKTFIKIFVLNDLRARDTRAFREFVNRIQPGVDMSIDLVDEDTGEPFRSEIAIGLDFFWPNV